HRELPRLPGGGEIIRDPLLAEGGAVEEAEGGEGLVVIAPGGVLLLDEEEEVGPDIGRPRALGRLAEVLGEGGDALDVDLDGQGRVVAESHVLDHSLAQRCHDALHWLRRRGREPPSSWLSRGAGSAR